MRHPERVEDYLGHIAEAIDRATSYIEQSQSIEAFQQNPLVQDAVVRNIEIIGEAANQINRMAPEFIAQHPELPWRKMRNIRNTVIHAYFSVDLTTIWRTVQEDLPPLKQQIDGLLKERQPDSSAEKKAAWSRQHTETEQSIRQREQNPDRGRER
jgi:uncharacterized protein with HEPN domain